MWRACWGHPVGRVAGQTRAPNPVAAVLVQTGQTLLLPEVALFERLQNVTSKTLHYELYKIFSLGQSALEEPHDDDMVGEGDGVVVELEGVGVGQCDGEH